MLAPHMGPGRAEHVAQKIAEQHARLGLPRHPAAVEAEAHARALISCSRGALRRLLHDDRGQAAQQIATHARGGMDVLVALELPGQPVNGSRKAVPPLPRMRRTAGRSAMPRDPNADIVSISRPWQPQR